MPVYTYHCENCGVQFDHQQKFSDKHLTRCPECNHNSLRRVYTPIGVVFKGSGFYVTDNRSASTSRTSKPVEKKTEEKPEKESKPKSTTDDLMKKSE